MKEKEQKKLSVGLVLLLQFIVLLVVFVLNAIMSGGVQEILIGIYHYIDVPIMISIPLFVLPAMLVSGTMKDFGRAFQIGRKLYSIGQIKKSLEAVEMTQRLVICGCMFPTLIMVIVLLYNMEDLTSVGPSLSVSLVAILYGVILESLLIPLHAHVQNRLTEALDVTDEEM